MAETSTDVPGYQDILRDMSLAMQIIRNNHDPCCYSPFLSNHAKAKVLR